MSRLGKKPIETPKGVTIDLSGQTMKVKGAKGEMDMIIPDCIEAKMEDGALVFSPRNDEKKTRALWGTTRANAQNLVTGVSEGFAKTLELVGIGYRAQMKGSSLELALGFSHPVVFEAPKGVAIATPKPTEITISGADKQVVGEIAAKIRKLRPPEPYKGKGVRYAGEQVRRKVGKKK